MKRAIVDPNKKREDYTIRDVMIEISNATHEALLLDIWIEETMSKFLMSTPQVLKGYF